MFFIKHKYGNQKYIFSVCLYHFQWDKDNLLDDIDHSCQSPLHEMSRLLKLLKAWLVILQIYKFSFEEIKQLFDWGYCFQVPRCRIRLYCLAVVRTSVSYFILKGGYAYLWKYLGRHSIYDLLSSNS